MTKPIKEMSDDELVVRALDGLYCALYGLSGMFICPYAEQALSDVSARITELFERLQRPQEPTQKRRDVGFIAGSNAEAESSAGSEE